MEHASYGWAKRVLDMGDKPTLHVMIIYQNRTAGYCAKDFYETIVSAFDGACDFRLDLWNFQVLAMPQINKTAAKAAGQADLVILSIMRPKPDVRASPKLARGLKERTGTLTISENTPKAVFNRAKARWLHN